MKVQLKIILLELLIFIFLALGSLKINAAFWYDKWYVNKDDINIMSNITYDRVYIMLSIWFLFNILLLTLNWKSEKKIFNALVVAVLSFASLRILTTGFVNKYTNFLMLFIDSKKVSFIITGLIFIVFGIAVLVKNTSAAHKPR